MSIQAVEGDLNAYDGIVGDLKKEAVGICNADPPSSKEIAGKQVRVQNRKTTM